VSTAANIYRSLLVTQVAIAVARLRVDLDGWTDAQLQRLARSLLEEQYEDHTKAEVLDSLLDCATGEWTFIYPKGGTLDERLGWLHRELMDVLEAFRGEEAGTEDATIKDAFIDWIDTHLNRVTDD
jgi:hypothetical protein